MPPPPLPPPLPAAKQGATASPPTTLTTFESISRKVHPHNPDTSWQELKSHLTATKVEPNYGEQPCPPGHTRWVCISDTHGQHEKIESVPDGDVLIHAGDLTNTGEITQIKSFCEWMGKHPHKHKVVIAGNHDITLDEPYYPTASERFHYKAPLDDTVARATMRESKSFTYLEDRSTSVLGYNVYGSPWQPAFCDWAFNLDRGEACAAKWSAIPDDTEVLITHGPPVGHGDLCNGGGNRAGCVDLLAQITDRIKPLYHVFGHVCVLQFVFSSSLFGVGVEGSF